jgi:ABC-2 type transport system permease protein
MLLSLLNVVKKELRQTLRERRMVVMLMAGPIIQLIAFGYAVNLDVDRIPAVYCDQDDTPESRALVEAFYAAHTFERVGATADARDATQALEQGRAATALIIPRGFARATHRGDAPSVQVLVDGTDSTRALIAAADASRFLLTRGIASSAVTTVPARRLADLVPRILYNPRLSSPIFMLPGVAASLLLNVTALVTAMGLARERETGTLEQILVTPIRPIILLAGKCLPFVLFGFIDVLAVLVIGSLLFDLPLRGSLAVVGAGSVLYLFSTLGMGIFIATLSSSQQQAMLLVFAFMLPALLISGFVSPIASMPKWLQPMTVVIPMRHYIEILRGALIKGAGLRDLATQFIALAILGTALLFAAVARFHKRLA